jgi:uncharacterized repeat protein (TIGR01451 family)
MDRDAVTHVHGGARYAWLRRRQVGSSARWLRVLLGSGLLASAFAFGLAQAAWADAPDVKIKPEKPLVTAKATFDTKPGHVTVEIIGAWSWPTHGKNCNEDRAGAGVAVDWFDPKDAGNALGASVTIEGKSVPIAVGGVGNSLNAADNVVHPTENDTGTGAVADIAKPSEYKSWRGGCGVFTEDEFFKSSEAAKKGELTKGKVAHGNLGHVAPGETDFEGNPFVNPTPPSSSALQGAVLKHVYEKPEDVTTICAVMYDVHPGTKASQNSGVGIPSGEKEVIAGATNHNKDNGVQGNAGTPAGNSCPPIELPQTTEITTDAGGPYTFDAKNGNDLKDKATLSGGTSTATGTLTFRLFEEAEIEGKVQPCGKELGKSEVTVKEANGVTYTSGGVHVSKAGTYHWIAEYSGDEKNLASKSECGAEGENPKVLTPGIEVTKSPTFQSVFKGGTAEFEITVKNTGEVDLENVKVTDLATASCNKEIGTLKVGESKSYKCTTSALENPFNNVAEACGSSEGVEVCDEGEAPVGIEELASVQDFKPKDTATVTVKAPKGAEPTALNGKLTFKLFKGACEAANLIYSAEVAVDAKGSAKTESTSFLSALLSKKGLSTNTEGTYNWQISYDGDTNGNKAFTGKCGTEHFTVTNS